jgi:hypothetical protein
MKKQLFKIAVLAFGSVVGISLLGLLVLDLPGASAEDVPELWFSSADPPAGISLEALSPPDQPDLDNDRLDETPELLQIVRSQRIAGSAFRPRDSVVDFDVNTTGGCIYAENNAFDVFNTPIWLPQGATVNQLRMYYRDTSDSNSTAWFTVYDLYGEIVDEWSVSSSGNFGNGFNDSPVIDHTIDYNSYSYLINWRPVVAGTTMQLCGFRIFYEPPPFGIQFLPYVERP